jgi:group I intron endonuclease
MEFINQETYKDNIGIYSITNILNGHQYIGQTGERFQRRYWHHRWKLRNGCHDNPYLQASYNKYGEDAFVFEVLETVSSIAELDAHEIQQIAAHPDAYNILKGGGGRRGTPMSEHAKAIVGEKNRVHMSGRKHSEETKRKMSETRRGQSYTRHSKTNVISESIAREIKARLLNGQSVSAIAKELAIPRNTVANILSNNTWDNVLVDGWDEFCRNRPKASRLHKDEVQRLLSDYYHGASISQLANTYHRSEKVITKLIGRHST